MEVDPGTYRPLQLAGFDVEPWVVTDVVAVSQYLIRRFGAFGGQELIRLQELQNFGQEWFDQNRPINDPSAPTTIPSSLGISGARTWRWSGQTVRPEVIQRIQEREAGIDRLERAVDLPPKFGSFAVQITTEKSATGNVMLLGCPQMGEPQPDEANAVNEVELACPGLHVGGMTVAGIPGVIIGHNEDMTWSLTSGISDNTDVYIETTQDESLSFYWFNGLWEEFEAIPDTVYDNNEAAYPFTVYRTVHGPVFDADLSELQAYTYKMAYWNLELDMARAFYMVSKAGTLSEFESAVQLFPVSFNVFYAGRDQTLKYWHAGRYNDRTDGVDPRLPHNGDGSEEWGGIIPFVSLPMAEDPGQGYFVNWNNKPVDWWDNGDNIPWVGWHPVIIINNYVSPIPSFTFEDLKGTPQAIGSHGTYQQAVEFGAADIIDENIVPPGQSAFVNLEGVPSPHVDDQWPLHVAWKFKDMLFGYDPTDVEPPVSAARLRFLQNEPNPFTSRTRIPFVLSKAQHVTLSVFDPAGRRIRTLLDQRVPAGGSSVWWDGTNEMGRSVPSGPYFYRLELGSVTTTRKALLLR
jgi:penicillin amidase